MSESRIVFLDGPGVYLRPPEEADVILFARWFNDPEVRRFISNVVPMTMPAEREWYEERHKKNATDPVFVIVDKDGDAPIGTMGLHGINHRNGTATTGAMIGEKGYWGKGFGHRAKMTLLKHAFHTLNLRKIYSRVHASNGRSRAYSEKCGYELEATLKEDVFLDGKYVDLHILSVYREKWEPLWDEFLGRHPKPW